MEPLHTLFSGKPALSLRGKAACEVRRAGVAQEGRRKKGQAPKRLKGVAEGGKRDRKARFCEGPLVPVRGEPLDSRSGDLYNG